MSGTRRTPIARSRAPSIPPRAIELFKATEKASRQRQAAIVNCVVNTYGFCRMECGPCRGWADAHSELHLELHLKPWEWPCLPVNPFPPGSPAARDWEPSGPELALWQTLERARRATLAAPAGGQPCPLSGKSDIEPTSPNDRV